MAMVMEQNQLFVLSASKRGDMEGPVSIHQDDLVIGDRNVPALNLVKAS